MQVTLDLSKNHMDDAAVAGIMDALRINEEMQIQARGTAGVGGVGEPQTLARALVGVWRPRARCQGVGMDAPARWVR